MNLGTFVSSFIVISFIIGYMPLKKKKDAIAKIAVVAILGVASAALVAVESWWGVLHFCNTFAATADETIYTAFVAAAVMGVICIITAGLPIIAMLVGNERRIKKAKSSSR